MQKRSGGLLMHCWANHPGTFVRLSWSNPVMITDCFGVRQWDLSGTETLFVQGVFALVKLLVPVALSVHTWKVHQSGRAHHRRSLLGLEKTTSPCEPDAFKLSNSEF